MAIHIPSPSHIAPLSILPIIETIGIEMDFWVRSPLNQPEWQDFVSIAMRHQPCPTSSRRSFAGPIVCLVLETPGRVAASSRQCRHMAHPAQNDWSTRPTSRAAQVNFASRSHRQSALQNHPRLRQLVKAARQKHLFHRHLDQ